MICSIKILTQNHTFLSGIAPNPLNFCWIKTVHNHDEEEGSIEIYNIMRYIYGALFAKPTSFLHYLLGLMEIVGDTVL